MLHRTKLLQVGLALAVLAGAALPAGAVTTSFANFASLRSGSNIYWKNSGTAGSFYTIATKSSKVLGAAPVSFNFLVGGLPLGVRALFTLSAATPAIDPAISTVPFLTEPLVSGSFSFIANCNCAAGQQIIGGQKFVDGDNLLSSSFTAAVISGVKNGTAAGFNDSSASGGIVSYTSDFLDFSNTIERDFSLTLGSVAPRFTAAAGKALTTFNASANGTFGSDPQPAVPEPASWALLVTGFALMGGQLRRRRALAA